MASRNSQDKRKQIKDKSSNGTTLIDLKKQLLDSVTQSKPKVVKRLMDSRVDPNCSNELGETPLIIACQLEDVETRNKIVPLLLKRDASVNLQDVSGNSALSHAIANVDEHLVESLLERGTDVSLTTGAGNSMLCCAAVSGNAKITKIILRETLKQKLPVDHKNMHGLTPLLLAAQGGHIDVARILVKEGRASVTIRDLDNFMTAEQWMKHLGFHSPQEIAFLSPRGRHRKKNTTKSLLDSVMELESESLPDVFGIHKPRQDQKQPSPSTFSLPRISSSQTSLSAQYNDATTRSIFDSPLTSNSSSSSKFKTELLPSSRVAKHDIYSSSYLSKRKSLLEHKSKSKFYATGSLEPLSFDGANHRPPSLKRMTSIVAENNSDEGSNKSCKEMKQNSPSRLPSLH